MRSFSAAGVMLAMCLLCAQVKAGFPQSSMGEPSVLGQRPSYSRPSSPQPQVPAYAARNSLVPAGARGPIGVGVPMPPAPVASMARAGCAAGDCAGPVVGGPAVGGPLMGGPAMGGPAMGGSVCPLGSGYQSSPYFQSMAGPWAPGGVYAPAAAASGGPRWFGGVYGIVMSRGGDDTHHFVTDCTRMFLPSDAVSTDYTGGVEARFGCTFDCSRYGLEVVYWGIDPNDEQASVSIADTIVPMLSTLNYGDIYVQYVDPATGAPAPYVDPVTGTSYPLMNAAVIGDAAVYTRVRHSEEFQNLELNLMSGPLSPASNCCGCDPCGMPYGNCRQPRWKAGWLFGVRYFKFDENLSIVMDNADTVIDHASPNNELFHDIMIENDLVGVQLGLNMDYCLTDCLQFDLASKFGLYGNHVSHHQKICNSYSIAYVDPTNPMAYNVTSDEDDVAFLGELRAGLGYRIGCNVRVTGGYRVVAASGVATAVGQIKSGRVMGKLAEVADVDTDDTLVLHGAYAGLEFAW